jgi:hypothetical protein
MKFLNILGVVLGLVCFGNVLSADEIAYDNGTLGVYWPWSSS